MAAIQVIEIPDEEEGDAGGCTTSLPSVMPLGRGKRR